MPYANNKGTDQHAHPHSLISTFIVCCLDSIIPNLAISKNSRFKLASEAEPSEAEQAGLSPNWSQTPKTSFLVTRLISYVSRDRTEIRWNKCNCNSSGLAQTHIED